MKMQTVFKIFKLKIVIVLFFNFQHVFEKHSIQKCGQNLKKKNYFKYFRIGYQFIFDID